MISKFDVFDYWDVFNIGVKILSHNISENIDVWLFMRYTEPIRANSLVHMLHKF